MSAPCPRFTALLQWRDLGDEAAIASHLAACPGCAAAWADLAALTALGASLPTGLPPPRRIESVRTAILAQAEAPPAQVAWRRWALAAGILVAIGAGWLLLRAPTPLGQIEGEAAYAISRAADGERITLRDGRISVEVAATSGQRLVIATADAEIEARRGRFAVEARDGRLVAIEVVSGAVELRRAGAAPEAIEDGGRWALPPPDESPESSAPRSSAPATAPVAPAAPASHAAVEPPKRPAPPRARPVEPPARPASAPSVAPPSAAAPTTRPQIERFEAGWVALRAGRHAEAVVAFEAAARLNGPLRADAEWWHLVALGRSGDDPATRRAAMAFLERRPGTARAAQAAVMLGWIEFEAGRIDAAERAFERGAHGGDASAQAQAQKGLAAIEAWRAARR